MNGGERMETFKASLDELFEEKDASMQRML